MDLSSRGNFGEHIQQKCAQIYRYKSVPQHSGFLIYLILALVDLWSRISVPEYLALKQEHDFLLLYFWEYLPES